MRCLAASAVALLAATGCADAQPTALDPGRAHDDLRALAGWVDAEASFTAEARATAHALLDSLLAEPDATTEAEFYLQVASVVALADNGHSNLTLGPVYGFGILPVRTFWFSDGLAVVRARSDHAELLGAQIDSIEGVATSRVAEIMGGFAGGTAGYFRQYHSSPLLLSPPVLQAAGIASQDDRLRLSMRDAAGMVRSVTVELEDPSGAPGRQQPWRRLLPDALPGEAGGWQVLATDSVPLWLRDSGASFRYVTLPGHDAVYVQLRANRNQNGSLTGFAEEARSRIAADQPHSVVLDNRVNPGGNLNLAAEFALDLPTLVPQEGRILVLTSNATFSAGIYTSFFPKATDPGRTLIVGETVGDRERFWAESNGPFTLPASGYRIGTSRQLHDAGAGCDTPERCHLAGAGRRNIAVGSFDPDLPVVYRLEDFVRGHDPVLERALAAIGPAPIGR